MNLSSVKETPGAPTLAATPAARPALPITEDVREAMRDAYRDLRLQGRIGQGDDQQGGSLEIRFVKDPKLGLPVDTACWFYDRKEKNTVICLGEEIGKHVVKNHADFGRYAQSYVKHEGAHDRWTARNLQQVFEACDKQGVSRSQLNLWEDARIEHKARKKWGVEFNWSQFEAEPQMSPKAPYSVLFSYVWHEGKRELVEEQARRSGVDAAMVQTVGDFYREGIRQSKTTDLIPLAVRFREAFEKPNMGLGLDEDDQTGEKKPGPGPASPGGESSSSPSAPGSGKGKDDKSTPSDGAGSGGDAKPADAPKSESGDKSSAAGSPGAGSDAGGKDGSKPDASSSSQEQGADGAGNGKPAKDAAASGAGDAGKSVTPSPGTSSEKDPSSSSAAPGSVDPTAGKDGSGAGAGAPGTSTPATGGGKSAGGAGDAAAGGSTGGSNDIDWEAKPRAQDMEAAADLSGDRKKRAKVLAGTSSATESADEGAPSDKGVGGSSTAALANSLTVSEYSKGNLVSQDGDLKSFHAMYGGEPGLEVSTSIDRDRVDEIVRALEPSFLGRHSMRYREEPSRRFDARRYSNDRDDCWSYKADEGYQGRRRVTLLFDCSGSMMEAKEKSPFSQGKELIAALGTLAERGRIEGQVIFHRCEMEDARVVGKWHSLRLPIPDQVLNNILPLGCGEGISATMEGAKPLLAQSDFVGLYTDGNIVDAPLDRQPYQNSGIFTYGLFAGPVEKASKLEKYVDYPLIGGDSIELARMLSQQIASSGFNSRAAADRS